VTLIYAQLMYVFIVFFQFSFWHSARVHSVLKCTNIVIPLAIMLYCTFRRAGLLMILVLRVFIYSEKGLMAFINMYCSKLRREVNMSLKIMDYTFSR
jgi:hypothetical protein